MKNIFIQEKLILWLTFNLGLALTGFRTTRPSITNKTITWCTKVAFIIRKPQSFFPISMIGILEWPT